MTTRQQKAKQITQELSQHTGTTQYTRMYPGVLLTDGTMDLCKQAECYRLMDIVYSILPKVKNVDDPLFVLDVAVRHDDEDPEIGKHKVFQVSKDNMAVVVIHNGMGATSEHFKVYHRQEIPYTDLCFSRLQLFIGTHYHSEDKIERIVLLPSEY